MEELEVTRLSTKGQVVIPRRLRDSLGLEPGDKFVVVGEGETLVLKRLSSPDRGSFADLTRRARRLARERGLTEAHVSAAIRKARSR